VALHGTLDRELTVQHGASSTNDFHSRSISLLFVSVYRKK